VLHILPCVQRGWKNYNKKYQVTSISNTQDDFLCKFSLKSKAWNLYYHACWQGDIEQGLFELGERSGKLYHPRERNENRGIFHLMSAAQYRPERSKLSASVSSFSRPSHTHTRAYFLHWFVLKNAKTSVRAAHQRKDLYEVGVWDVTRCRISRKKNSSRVRAQK
jgi:hypothetical protein